MVGNYHGGPHILRSIKLFNNIKAGFDYKAAVVHAVKFYEYCRQFDVPVQNSQQTVDNHEDNHESDSEGKVSEAASKEGLSVPLAIVHSQEAIAFFRGRDVKRVLILPEESGEVPVAPVGDQPPKKSQYSQESQHG